MVDRLPPPPAQLSFMHYRIPGRFSPSSTRYGYEAVGGVRAPETTMEEYINTVQKIDELTFDPYSLIAKAQDTRSSTTDKDIQVPGMLVRSVH